MMSAISLYIILFIIIGDKPYFGYCDGLVYRTKSFDRAKNVPDAEKITPDLIEKNGYVAEVHEITTEDDYILLIHRIPHGLQEGRSPQKNKPIVIIEHGIIASSDTWLLLGPKSLPFILAENGFDVWVGNSRGNRYALRHKQMLSSNSKFWEFSHHEIGYYDLAATIDYTLKLSGQSGVFLIGHSRGTTQTFILLSTRPEYNKKIKLFIALAPVVYLKHSNSPILQAFFQNTSPKFIMKLAKASQIDNLPEVSPASIPIRQAICGRKSKLQDFCLHVIFQVSGFHPENLNKSILSLVFTHYPDGASIRDLLHHLQVAISDQFSWFDHGKQKNLKIYGVPKPPNYDLSKVTAPVSLHYADNDYFTSKRDLQRLFGQLKNKTIYRVPEKRFNHLDFTWGSNADELIYKPIVEIMKKYL